MTEQGTLRECKEDLAQKRETIRREVHAIGCKYQVEEDKIREKLKLFERRLMTALTCGFGGI